MISFDQASAILRSAAEPLEAVELPISETAGLRLAQDLTAGIDAPRCDVSIMDGYAVRDEDLPGPLRVTGISCAGSPPGLSINAGDAVRIFTGAPVPDGAQRVIVQEITEREGDMVRVAGEYGEARHIRVRASDFAKGDVLLAKGSYLGPGQIVAAAAADRAKLSVWRRPRVAILATGDELVEPGRAGNLPGRLPDSITLALASLTGKWGGDVVGRKMCGDDPDAIAAIAAHMLEQSDILVIVGGASVGERDFATASVAGTHFETLFAKVSMRPGRPVWCAQDKAETGRFVLGLPGNPASALVTARLFLAPLLSAFGGGRYDEALMWHKVELAAAMPAPGLREHFGRGKRAGDKAEPFTNQLSGVQSLLAYADVLLRQSGGSDELPQGANIASLDF